MKMRYAIAKMVLLCLTANKDIRMEKMTGGGGCRGEAGPLLRAKLRSGGSSTSAASENAGEERNDAENKHALAYSANALELTGGSKLRGAPSRKI